MTNSKKPFLASKRNVVIVAIIYSFLWGCAFPLVKLCMESFGISGDDQAAKCLLAGIRFSASGLITLLALPLIAPGERLMPTKKELIYSGGYGIVATTLQYAFTYIGLSMIDGSKGAVYDQLGVFIIVLFSGLIFADERLTLKKGLGCIIGFVGVLMISVDGSGFSFSLGGEGVMLLAVACQTGSYFIAKASSGSVAAPKLVGYGQLIGGVILTSLSLLLGGRIERVNATAILTLLALTLISAIAYCLSLMPLKYFPVSEVSSFNLLITIFGVVMSAAILGENIFRLNYAASLALISLGIFCINSRKKSKSKS